MKSMKLRILALMGVGVMYSGSGGLQVNAALFTYSVNFSTKEVANFNDFTPAYSSETYNLDAKIINRFAGTYYFDSCPSPVNVNITYNYFALLNGGGSAIGFTQNTLPDFVCTTTPTTYESIITRNLSDNLVLALMSDDAAYVRFVSELIFAQTGATAGLVLNLSNFLFEYTLQYDFNTTYLFNYFLSDTSFSSQTYGGSWSIGSEAITSVDYVFTTAGNDEYRVINTDFLANLGTLRKKYAVNVDGVYFRGNSVGAKISRKNNTNAPFTTDKLTMGSSGNASIVSRYNYFYLNTSNYQQPLDNVPEFDYEYQDCGWNVFDIPCFINNGIAYVVNDAPVVSDAFTLLNAGMKLGGQAFGIIGQFTDNNLFGVLILGGMGITAVRWFLKND